MILVEPIGGDDPVALTPAYLELRELLKQVTPDKGYPLPTAILQRIITRRGYPDPTDDPAFPHLASFLKQQTPTVELLNDMYWMAGLEFHGWIRRMDRIYYPVHEVLTLHSKIGFLTYRDMEGKVEDLAQNVIHTLGEKPPRSLHFRRDWKLTPDQELTIALAYAQLCNLKEHSYLLVTERASGHWSRVVTDDISECLLDHGHDPERMHKALTGKALRSIAELKYLLHVDVPSLSAGAL